MRIFVASIVLLVSIFTASTAAQSAEAKKLLGQEPYFVPVEGEAFQRLGGRQNQTQVDQRVAILKKLPHGRNHLRLMASADLTTRYSPEGPESAVFKIGDIGLVWSQGSRGPEKAKEEGCVIIIVAEIPGQQNLRFCVLNQGIALEDITDPTQHPYRTKTLGEKQLQDYEAGRTKSVSIFPENFGPKVKFGQVLLVNLGNSYGAIEPVKIDPKTDKLVYRGKYWPEVTRKLAKAR